MKRNAQRLFLPALMLTLVAGTLPPATCYGKNAKPKATRKVRHTKPPRHTRTAKPAKSHPIPGLLYESDVKAGTGAVAATGTTVSVQYTGWLYDRSNRTLRGVQIDNSQDRGKPFQFKLGAHQVIQGWDVGVTGMKVGGERIIVVPGLSYGTRSAGGVTIPPNTPMLYDITLLGVQ